MTAAVAAQAPAVPLKVGDTAPDFTLKGSDGKTYSLADYRGKKAVVVAWFPKAFTQGCTLECKSLAANGDRLRKFDVAYFMASVDARGRQHEVCGNPSGPTFRCSATRTRAWPRVTACWAARGLANRWTFYIDRNGTDCLRRSRGESGDLGGRHHREARSAEVVN